MKGKIGFDARMKRYYISWYNAQDQKTYKVWFYKGLPMDTQDLAERLLAVMRSDYERGVFRLDKFIHQKSEVVPFLIDWLETKIKQKAPATYYGWKSTIKNHLQPFFDGQAIGLHEIDYGILLKLKNGLELSDRSKKEVLGVLKRALVYAKKLNRIDAVPEFPNKEDYELDQREVVWLPEERQMNIINHIPQEHQPLFAWLKYHMRRPGEARALHKADYVNGVFYIRRTFSAHILHDKTKVKRVIEVPCAEAFKPYIEWMRQQEWWIASPFFFVNPRAQHNQHYIQPVVSRIWNNACEAVGEDIPLYAGTKHSSVSQLINEYGMNKYHVQIALDCDPRTIAHYSKVEVATRKSILDKVDFRTKSHDVLEAKAV